MLPLVRRHKRRRNNGLKNPFHGAFQGERDLLAEPSWTLWLWPRPSSLPSFDTSAAPICTSRVAVSQKCIRLVTTSPCGGVKSGDRQLGRATPVFLTGIPPSEYDCLASSNAMSIPLESSILTVMCDQYNSSEIREFWKLICLWKDSVDLKESPSLGHPHHCPMLSSRC